MKVEDIIERVMDHRTEAFIYLFSMAITEYDVTGMKTFANSYFTSGPWTEVMMDAFNSISKSHRPTIPTTDRMVNYCLRTSFEILSDKDILNDPDNIKTVIRAYVLRECYRLSERVNEALKKEFLDELHYEAFKKENTPQEKFDILMGDI